MKLTRAYKQRDYMSYLKKQDFENLKKNTDKNRTVHLIKKETKTYFNEAVNRQNAESFTKKSLAILNNSYLCVH